MALDIQIKRSSDSQNVGTLIVELGGRLDSATSPQLEKVLAEAMESPFSHLVFDLKNMVFISSAGLRVFAVTRKLMQKRDEEVSFVNLQPQIQEVFEIVKALPGIAVFSNIGEFDTYLATRQKKILEGD